MKAIKVKWIGPTTTKPTRLVASAEPHNRNRIVRSLNIEMTWDENARDAAKALADKLGWSGYWVGGFLDNNTGIYVNTLDGHDFFETEGRD